MFSTLPSNPFPPSTEQMNKGDNTELNNRVHALETSVNGILNGTTIDSFGDVETALSTKASNEIIAPLFDETSGVYAVGDLVVYDGELYQFTSAHETAGAWDSSEVSAVKVSEELATLESGLTNLIKITSTPLDNSTLSPGGYKADACTLSIPTGYTLVGFYVVPVGAYTSYCTFYTSVAGVIQATNTHQTETAELIGVVVALFVKTAYLN